MYKGPLELAPARAQSLQPRPHKTMAETAARSPMNLTGECPGYPIALGYGKKSGVAQQLGSLFWAWGLETPSIVPGREPGGSGQHLLSWVCSSPAAAAVAQCTLDGARGCAPGPCQLPGPAPELRAQVLRASEEDPGPRLGATGEAGERQWREGSNLRVWGKEDPRESWRERGGDGS